MAFITGLLLIDAPASALNNSADPIQGARAENTSATKFIRTRQGFYPYVSAQAFRFWLRDTLERDPAIDWPASHIARESKVAYTDGNPVEFWDDDLLGYMRAPSKKGYEESLDTLTPLELKSNGSPIPVTRVSPFRVSTLVSIEPAYLNSDFGVMARHEGDPVPYEHQFYRAVLVGLYSLDLRAAGTFTFRDRTGYRNLDAVRRQMAEERGLELVGEDAYRLPFEQRAQRVQALLYGLARLEGGAKQAIHYTDVSPSFVITAVTRGGNHIFGRVIVAQDGQPSIHQGALDEALNLLGQDILSMVHVGRVQGFMDAAAEMLTAFDLDVSHPRQALDNLAAEIARHPEWWE